jgi:hypothetical protein
VVLTNHDLFRHTFTIDQLHVHLEAPLGSTREAGFAAPTGPAGRMPTPPRACAAP